MLATGNIQDFIHIYIYMHKEQINILLALYHHITLKLVIGLASSSSYLQFGNEAH